MTSHEIKISKISTDEIIEEESETEFDDIFKVKLFFISFKVGNTYVFWVRVWERKKWNPYCLTSRLVNTAIRPPIWN